MKRFISGTFYYGFSSIIGRVIGFFMLPIYTSKLTPTDYGVVAFLTLYVALVQLLFGSRLDQAVSKYSLDKNNNMRMNDIWSSALVASTLITIIPLLLSIYFSAKISVFLFDSDAYQITVSIFSVNILFAITENYGFLYLRLSGLQKKYLQINIIKLFTQLLFNILLIVIYDFGVNGVAISSAISFLLSSILTIYIAKSRIIRFTFNLKIIKILIKYSWPLWATALFGMYTSTVQQPLINFFDGTESLGVFNLANTLSSLLVAVFWAPFLAFWQVERFKYVDSSNFMSVYQTVFYTTTVISILISMSIGLFSYPIINLMTSNRDFLPAYKAAYPLAMSLTFTYLTYYMNFPFLLKEKTGSIFKINVYSGITLSILLSIAAVYSDFVGIAYALMINNFLTFVYTGITSQNIYNLGVPVIKTSLILILSTGVYYLGDFFTVNLTTDIYDLLVRVVILMLLIFVQGLLFFVFLRRLGIIDMGAIKKIIFARKLNVTTSP